MEALLNRFRDLNYEIFGIILPGIIFFGLLFWVYDLQLLAQDQTFLLSISTKSWTLFDLASKIKNDLHFAVALSLVIALPSYFLGHLLKWVAKNGIWNLIPLTSRCTFVGDWIGAIFEPSEQLTSNCKATETQIEKERNGGEPKALPELQKTLKGLRSAFEKAQLTTRFVNAFLLRQEIPHKSYRPSLLPAVNASAEMMVELAKNKKASIAIKDLSEWSAFYLVAKDFLLQKETTSSLALYQNKYTYHRSLSSAFAISAWLALVQWGYFIFATNNGVAKLAFFTAILSLVFSRLFFVSYEYFYILWGDHLIGETFALLSTISENKNDDSTT